jgi:hypothetical protein
MLHQLNLSLLVNDVILLENDVPVQNGGNVITGNPGFGELTIDENSDDGEDSLHNGN